MKKKICVITGSRAEYGLLLPLMKRIKRDKELDLQLIVTGSHMSKEFGFTYRQIKKDGFDIDVKISLDLKKDNHQSLTNASSKIVKNIGRSFQKLLPDLIIVLGDRYEILATALAATLFQIPIGHIHGGEITRGSMDDSMRHAISKLAHLHFVSHSNYKRRLVQLGEVSRNITVVGAMGLENIKNLKLLSKKELEKELKFSFRKKTLMATFHSETSGVSQVVTAIKNLFKVLNDLSEINVIFTSPNSDIGSNEIKKLIRGYVSQNLHRAVEFNSLGQLKYLSVLKYADGVIGNSSSGIIEAPSFKKGTINIGSRQNGRIQTNSIINSTHHYDSIFKSIKKLYSKSFQKTLRQTKNPLDLNLPSKKCIEIIKNKNLSILNNKYFNDVLF